MEEHCLNWIDHADMPNLLVVHEHRGDVARLRIAIVQRWRRLRRRRGSTVVHVGTAHDVLRLNATASGISMQVWPATSPTASVEERLAALEQLPDLIAAQFERERRAQDDARREQAWQLRREIREEVRLLAGDAATTRRSHERLEKLLAGNTRLGWLGVLLLLPGIAFTTWPDGIAAWPTWLFVCLIALLALAAVCILIYRPKSR